jgi:hypothetical protein
VRNLLLILLLILVVLFTVAYYPRPVEKPEKDGPGPLAVYISPRYAAPEYHSPLDYWKRHHTDMMNRGDLAQSDCLYCHEPERSCNHCHSYVGANKILE